SPKGHTLRFGIVSRRGNYAAGATKCIESGDLTQRVIEYQRWRLLNVLLIKDCEIASRAFGRNSRSGGGHYNGWKIVCRSRRVSRYRWRRDRDTLLIAKALMG